MKPLAACLLLSLMVGAQTAPFPRAAARAYLAGTADDAAALRTQAGDDASAPSARSLAHFVLGTGEAARESDGGADGPARADLAAAASFAPLRDAAAAALIALLDRDHDATAVLEAATRFPLPATDPFYSGVAQAAANAAQTLQLWPQVLTWTSSLPATPALLAQRAQAEAASGDARAAAELVRTLVYRHPAASEAAAALAAWPAALAQFPDLAPDWQLLADQAQAWSNARRYRQAAASWVAAAVIAPATQRPAIAAERARALLGAGDLAAAGDAIHTLAESPERPQALELEVELARAAKDRAAIAEPLATLAEETPTSAWYARALHEAGDEDLIEAELAGVKTNFDELARRFPDSSYAQQAMWQAAWAAYRLGGPDTAAHFEAYLKRYPAGFDAPDAWYWLGTWQRRDGQTTAAAASFHTAAVHFPGTYFGLESAVQLPALLPPAAARMSAAPSPAALAPELQRVGWLHQAGLLDPAATILESVYRSQPAGAASLAVARQLADLEGERQAWFAGLTAMIRALPGYLDTPPAAIAPADWRRLFPLPYAAAIDQVAAHYNLPASLLDGLIRQESGFDPRSVSPTQARGLMQLELATARIHFPSLPAAFRQLAGPAPLLPAALFIPEVNLALGTAELRTLLDRFHDPVFALAAYNAGPSRVALWQSQYPGITGNEFIESIPFSETRAYVESVLRNRAHYQALYPRR